MSEQAPEYVEPAAPAEEPDDTQPDPDAQPEPPAEAPQEGEAVE